MPGTHLLNRFWFSGSKGVAWILYFWQTPQWCQPCRSVVTALSLILSWHATWAITYLLTHFCSWQQKYSNRSNQSLNSNEFSHFILPQEPTVGKKLLLLGAKEGLCSRLESSLGPKLSCLFTILQITIRHERMATSLGSSISWSLKGLFKPVLQASQEADSELEISRQDVLGINTCGWEEAGLGSRHWAKMQTPGSSTPEPGMALQSCPKWNQRTRPFYPHIDQSVMGYRLTLERVWPWQTTIFLCRQLIFGTVQKLVE